MAQTDVYFVGQGKIYIADLNASRVPQGFRYVGNVPKFEISFETDVVEHKESYSGQRQIDLRFNRQNKANVAMTLEDWDKENLKLLAYGSATSVTGSTVTNEAMPTLAADLSSPFYFTSKMAISSVTVKDSAGSPATLTAGTHYALRDANAGLIEVLNLASYTQPLKVDYTYAANETLAMFTQGLADRWIRFVGLNTTNSASPNKTVLVDLYRTSFSPTQTLSLIGDDVAQFELEGTVLYDDTRASNSQFGGFGRIIESTAFTG